MPHEAKSPSARVQRKPFPLWGLAASAGFRLGMGCKCPLPWIPQTYLGWVTHSPFGPYPAQGLCRLVSWEAGTEVRSSRGFLGLGC